MTRVPSLNTGFGESNLKGTLLQGIISRLNEIEMIQRLYSCPPPFTPHFDHKQVAIKRHTGLTGLHTGLHAHTGLQTASISFGSAPSWYTSDPPRRSRRRGTQPGSRST